MAGVGGGGMGTESEWSWGTGGGEVGRKSRSPTSALSLIGQKVCLLSTNYEVSSSPGNLRNRQICVNEASYLPTHFRLQVDSAPLAAKFDSSDGAQRGRQSGTKLLRVLPQQLPSGL